MTSDFSTTSTQLKCIKYKMNYSNLAYFKYTSSPSWELRTASPRGHYGERLQRDSCLKKHMKKHHPLAGDSPWRHYLRRDHNIRTAGWIHHCFFVFTDWSVWRNVHSGRNTVFLYLSWRALARRLRLCVDPCPRYLTPDDTHDRCVCCLGEEHARDVFEGAICVHCESSVLVCPSFRGKRGSRLLPARFDTHRCRGTEAIEIAGFAVGYGRWVREGPPLFACVGREREWAAGLWWCDLSDIIRFSG